jgi:hypothetical protein
MREGDHLEDPGVDGRVKVKFTLEQESKAQSGNRGIALLFLLPGIR